MNKYEISTDYERLYDLLNAGYLIVGFKNFNLIQLSYFSDRYEIGNTILFKDLINTVSDFENFCKQENLRYIDLKNIQL